MTAPTFQSWCQAGGGEIGAIYHVAGMPWAACTHASLVTALADTGDADVQNYRKWLFGDAVVNGLTPAYDVQLVQSLDPNLGKQVLGYDDGKGITGGDWDVTLGRGDLGLTYSYRTSSADASTPPGIYAGLEMMEDTLYDASIHRATLAANYDPFTDTDITYGGEGCSDLHAYINLNTLNGEATYMWAGSQCLGLHTSVGPVGGTYTASCVPCCYRTPATKVAMNVEEGGTVLLANAPHAGIVGCNAVLWLIQMQDGEIVGISGRTNNYRPVMFRCGPVANNPRLDPGKIKISHKHWLTWLDATIPTLEIDGNLSGYRFTRQSTINGGYGAEKIQMPHLMLHEWNATTSEYDNIEIWLCDDAGAEMDPGESISFTNLNDLCQRALKAIENSTTDNTYSGTVGDLRCDSFVDEHSYWITGPVAWVLGWGLVDAFLMADFVSGLATGAWSWQCYQDPEAAGWQNAFPAFIDGGIPSPAPQTLDQPNFADNTMGWRQVEALLPLTIDYPVIGTAFRCPPCPGYFYQYNWTVTPAVMGGWNFVYRRPWFNDPNPDNSEYVSDIPAAADRITQPGPGWPLAMDAGGDPGVPDPGDYRIHFDDAAASTDMIQDDLLVLGQVFEAYNAPDVVRSHQTQIASTGDNYAQPVTTSGNAWGDTGVPVFRKADGVSLLRWGADMTGWSDANLPMLADDVQSEKLTELLMGLLGADRDNVDAAYTPATVPFRRQVSYIPDLFGPSTDDWGGYSNFRRLIDFEQLEHYAGTNWTDIEFAIQTRADKYKISDALNGCLLSCGIRPIWEYSEAQRAWWLTFRPLGQISQAYAQQRGRLLDDSDVTTSEPKEVWGNTWLYNACTFKGNFAGETALLDLSCVIETGRAVIASGAKTLDITDHWTQIGTIDLDNVLSCLYSTVYRFAVAYPTIEIEVALSALPKIGVGCEISLTGDTLYNPYTAERGMEKIAAMITRADVGIVGNKASANLTLRVCPLGAYGISPSMDLDAGDYTRVGDTITVTGYSVLASENNYANPAGGLTDLQTFGQFTFDPNVDAVKYSDLGDTDGQRVRVVTKDVDAHYFDDSLGSTINVWLGTLKGSATDIMTYADGVTNGDFRIILDDATDYPANPMDVVVIYAPRDDEDIQPSQLVYGFIGDKNGKVYDSDDNAYRGMSLS